jgi:hypothetical protein
MLVVSEIDVPRRYPLGSEFPSEAFVQAAIERHFRDSGFEIDVDGTVDLACRHPVTGECWQIEAKGRTSSPGLDFQTCLGQLLVRMSTPDMHYAVALPELPEYRAQIAKVNSWVIDRLNLSWLLISSDGSIHVSKPDTRWTSSRPGA